MRLSAERMLEIRQFLLHHVQEHQGDIASFAAAQFQTSRQAIGNHLKALVADGLLEAEGSTRARVYRLTKLVDESLTLPVTPDLAEDRVWRTWALPLLRDLPDNVLAICQHGFTEILNNVVDHSASDTVRLSIERNAVTVTLRIVDFGVGIFRKLQRDLHLDDERHALLELSKGKLTTDQRRHTGEGIFFTSRMFDHFDMISGGLFFTRINQEHDVLLDVEERKQFQGTAVYLHIDVDAKQTPRRIFEEYTSEWGDFGFSRTYLPITLARYEREELVSRSQARRVLARLDRFREVVLDFQGVPVVGQAFADEIFRVYPQDHPEVHLSWINASPEIVQMIQRARSG